MRRAVETYRRRALWRRTLLDVVAWSRFGPKKWERRALRADAGCHQIEEQALESRRYPSESDRERPKYDHHEQLRDRLPRTTAFGQWANPLVPEQQSDAQHGLFGTSAALQVLSRSAWATAMLRHTSRLGSDTWVNQYLRTVNFIDMVVSSRNPTDGAAPAVAAELGVTLRACHAARAFAAAAPVLQALSAGNHELLRYVDPGVVEDLGGDLSEVAGRNATAIMNILADAQITSDRAPARGYRPQDATLGLPLYTFTAADDHHEEPDLPETADDWVFLHGSVLIALVRCWDALLIQDHNLAERICPLVGFTAFKHAMRKRVSAFPDLDDRLRLFGLWALSHLDTTTPGGPFGVAARNSGAVAPPPNLSLDADDLSWFRPQVRKVCGRLLSSEISLADSYSPYTFWIGPDKSDYKDDSLVVPVVPLLLSLAARYVPSTLSRTKMLRLIEACTDKDARRRYRLAARPHQLSTQDGVVNLSYYQEACDAIAVAARTSMSKIFTRIKAHASAFVHDWGKPALFGMFLLSGAVIYTIATIEHSTAAGFVYGVFASALAAVVVHGIVVWLWGDL